MGSIWGRQDPGGPHVGPMNFAIWVTAPWATQACCTATCNCDCAAVVGGLSVPHIWIAIWSQMGSVGFKSGFWMDDSWLPCFGSPVARAAAVWVGALSRSRTKLSWKTALDQGKRFCCSTRIHFLVHDAVHHKHLTFATIVKSSPYDDRWTNITICSLHTDIFSSMCLSPCGLRTRADDVYLYDAIWILTLQWRYGVPSDGCPKHDEVLSTDGGTDDALKSAWGIVRAARMIIRSKETPGVRPTYWQATCSATNWLGS